MGRLGRHAAAGTLAVALVSVVACGGEGEPAAAPAAPHGAVVLEPPTLRLGALATVEITVVTPPDHRVQPVRPPEDVPGLWLLSAERPPVRHQGERRIHTTRVRVRARDTGEHAWPEQPVEIEGPDGAVRTLTLPARPFTVASASAEQPDRLEPYGLRPPTRDAPDPGAWGFWGPALAGSAATLLAMAGVALVRRRRDARRARDGAAAEPAEPPWVVAERGLAAAAEAATRDPRASADAVAAALARYVQRRALAPVAPLTTEEIAAMRPPGRLRSRWPELVALLRELDVLRFSGALDREDGPEALRAQTERARAFVEQSIPPRELR